MFFVKMITLLRLEELHSHGDDNKRFVVIDFHAKLNNTDSSQMFC